MIKSAILYREELLNKFSDILLEDKYKYYFCGNNSLPEITGDQLEKHQFVSVNKYNEVIGFIDYTVNNVCHFACQLGAINFSDDKILFGNDLKQVIKDVFCKFHYTKLDFFTVVGNPITEHYIKMVKKHGGKVIGTYEKDVRIQTGEICDIIAFEILNKKI